MSGEVRSEKVVNDYHIKVKRICASCQHREILDNGTRICAMMQLKVKQKFVCPKWQMSDGLKNAGLQTGGVVCLKGTQETIIH